MKRRPLYLSQLEGEPDENKFTVVFDMYGDLFFFLASAGCNAPTVEEPNPALSFEAQIQENEGQEIHIRLGIRNRSPTPFAGDETFEGQMELRYADGERAGELRARAEIVTLSRLEPGDTVWPMTWRGPLDPGAYTLTWGADGYDETHVGFQIVERDGQMYLGS